MRLVNVGLNSRCRHSKNICRLRLAKITMGAECNNIAAMGAHFSHWSVWKRAPYSKDVKSTIELGDYLAKILTGLFSHCTIRISDVGFACFRNWINLSRILEHWLLLSVWGYFLLLLSLSKLRAHQTAPVRVAIYISCAFISCNLTFRPIWICVLPLLALLFNLHVKSASISNFQYIRYLRIEYKAQH